MIMIYDSLLNCHSSTIVHETFDELYFREKENDSVVCNKIIACTS